MRKDRLRIKCEPVTCSDIPRWIVDIGPIDRVSSHGTVGAQAGLSIHVLRRLTLGAQLTIQDFFGEQAGTTALMAQLSYRHPLTRCTRFARCTRCTGCGSVREVRPSHRTAPCAPRQPCEPCAPCEPCQPCEPCAPGVQRRNCSTAERNSRGDVRLRRCPPPGTTMRRAPGTRAPSRSACSRCAVS
jgi:hypothetical protein